MEVMEQERQKELNSWRRMRILGAAICRSLGNDIQPRDIAELPGDDKTNIDLETLKKLSENG